MPRSLAWLTLLCVCACDASSAPSLGFSVRFANPDTAARANSVEVSIVAGSCSGDDALYTSQITRDTEGAIPPRLPPGDYALLGRAISAQCGLIAYGCVQTELPATDGTTLQIVLADVPEQPICTGECAARCDLDEAGMKPPIGGDAAISDGGTSPDPAGKDAEISRDASMSEPDAGPQMGVDAGAGCDGVIGGPSSHCYRFDSEALNFAMAEAKCVSWGGHLVSFNDPAEELWVSQQAVVLGTFGTPPRFWIGFSDAALEKLWTWLDDSAPPSSIVFDLNDPDTNRRFKATSSVPYTHWGSNAPTVGNREPNNGSGDNPNQEPGEDCAESRGDRQSTPAGSSTPRAEWDDSSCVNLKPFVCERP